MFTTDDERRFDVVRNDEGQYSLWPAGRAAPGGWQAIGVQGTKTHCLEHISREWTDQRPNSLRRLMGG